jgi:hypothetical protein
MAARSLLLPIARLALLFGAAGIAMAQQSIGTVGIQDATVAGALEVTNGRAVLVGSTTITAKDHTAEVALGRGGKVLVCATSGLHVTAGKNVTGNQPLMLALDRGAIEVQTNVTTSDVVLTPDLRFSIQNPGPLDLRLRVTRNGDTCVENRGVNAPLLHIADQFGDASYELHSGQHVMFEHGSLKEVVDSETSPCGCPPAPVVSVADTGITSATPALPGSVVAAQQTAAQHPFPAAVSQGLAPAPPVPTAPAGDVHTQVATTLSYSAATPETAGSASSGTGTPALGSTSPAASGIAASRSATSGSATSGSATTETSAPAGNPTAAISVPAKVPAEVKAEAPLPPAPPSGTDIVHRIGHFFKRLFGRG